MLRYIYLQDGTFVNAELIRLGYAQVATFPPDVRHQDLFLQLQQEARMERRGLWSQTASDLPAPTQALSTNTPSPPTQTPVPLATLSPTQPPPSLPPPTQPPSSPAVNVEITHINYDGIVYRVESDEYAVITNNGSQVVNLAGWRLNADDPGQDFYFPSYELQPGQSCRVYTDEYHPEFCGSSFGSGRAIWNNDGDCGHLFDAGGAEVSTYCCS